MVIIQPIDNGNKPHPFGHAVVAGIERYPEKITRRMGKARQDRRSKIKPFIKVINYNHLMPTRYTLELEGLKGSISTDTFKEVSQREDAKKTVKKILEERYTSGKNRWFFTPLRKSFPLGRRHSPPSLLASALRLSKAWLLQQGTLVLTACLCRLLNISQQKVTVSSMVREFEGCIEQRLLALVDPRITDSMKFF